MVYAMGTGSKYYSTPSIRQAIAISMILPVNCDDRREILLARIRNPIFVQAFLKEKVPGNIKNTAEITRILVPDPG